MRTDSLIEGAKRMHIREARRRSSETTRYRHLKRAEYIVHILRELGKNVKMWKNVTNKHVAALVAYWQSKGLSIKSIKNYLSTIRRITRYYGNDRICANNSDFGVDRMKSVSNEDKSLPKISFDQAVITLGYGLKEYDLRFKAMLLLQRGLGLRLEESAKFDPRQSLRPDGRVLICCGTKGGRERILNQISLEGQLAIDFAKRIIGSNRNLIPKTEEMTEYKWLNLYFRRMGEIGLTRKEAGAGGHGNRHAYAQDRYEQITMFPPPCKFADIQHFVDEANRIAGDDWKKRDKAARTEIMGLLGHGPYRNGTVSQYLGSSGRVKK